MKKIIKLGEKSKYHPNSQIIHGYIETIGNGSAIKILFKPHGSYKVGIVIIKELTSLVEQWLTLKDFYLEDGGHNIKSSYTLCKRRYKTRISKGGLNLSRR